MPVTQHFGSHVEIIRKFLEWKVVAESVGDLVRVRVGASSVKSPRCPVTAHTSKTIWCKRR
jgi:hypothetical protein